CVQPCTCSTSAGPTSARPKTPGCDSRWIPACRCAPRVAATRSPGSVAPYTISRGPSSRSSSRRSGQPGSSTCCATRTSSRRPSSPSTPTALPCCTESRTWRFRPQSGHASTSSGARAASRRPGPGRRPCCRTPTAKPPNLTRPRGPADRIGRRQPLLLAVVDRCLVGFLFIFASAPWHLFAIRILAGVTSAARDPSATALLATHSTKGKRGTAFAWYHTARDLGRAVGFAAAGFVIQFSGNYRLVFLAAFLSSCASLVTVTRYVRENRDIAERLPGPATEELRA